MAYLNAQQRQELSNELARMKFNKAKAKVRSLDHKGRMVFHRNSQVVGQWMTRYDLPTLGTRVTLVESEQDKDHEGKLKAEFDMSEVIVEPLPDNKT
jgi:hypothetical protein